MRRPGASEMRNLMFEEAEAVAQERDRRAAEERGPTPMEQQSACMLQDGFGRRATVHPTPILRQLHAEFVRAQEQGTRPARAVERLNNPTALPVSGRYFFIDRSTRR